jgi:hypothetical protein
MSRILTGSFAVRIVATALLSIAAPLVASASAQPGAAPGASDQVRANVDLARPPVDERLERPEVEVIESAGRNIPNPLTPQRIEYFLTESVTTSKAGHLLVAKSMEITTTCTPTSGVLYFLLVDDVPIRNSAVFSRTGMVGQVSGVTTDVVTAGTHTIKVGQVCTVPGATPTGGSVALIGITSVIVLP